MTTSRVAVTKFGGSTFKAADGYAAVAEHLLSLATPDAPVVSVVSAASGETERLRQMLHEVSGAPSDQNVAGLLTLADTVSAQLLRAAVERLGGRVAVLAGHENGIATDATWMWARIRHHDPEPLSRALAAHDVVVLPGGQASDGMGRATWLGKNSSDLSAVASSVGAPTCDIYSDVDAVYTADPALVPDAVAIPELSYGMSMALAARGARVLHRRAVALAQQHDIVIRCRLNRPPFSSGTRICEVALPCTAVVIDLSSVLVELRHESAADRAHEVFDHAGIQSVRPQDLERPLVAVTGGYVDVERFLRDHEIEARSVPGRLISVVTGMTSSSHLARDDEHAVHLGRRLHEQVVA